MSLEADIDILRGLSFFEGFSNEHLRLIAFSAESRSLPERLLLYDEGQALHSAFIVASGSMIGERRTKAGSAARRGIGPGTMLGERALIFDTRAMETVRVETRSRVLQIRKTMFRRLLEEYPDITAALRARIARNLVRSAGEFDRVAERLRGLLV